MRRRALEPGKERKQKEPMEETCSEQNFFGTARIGTILWKIAPPVMLAQLIQALYNVGDSFLWGTIPTMR